MNLGIREFASAQKSHQKKLEYQMSVGIKRSKVRLICETNFLDVMVGW
jgi:hypothetical protein